MSPQFTAKLYNHLLVFLLLCVCLAYFCCHAKSEIDNTKKAIQCVESERDALLEFKRGILVDRCGLLDSWGVTQDCCQWHGIQCHNHSAQVISLRLPTPQNYYDNDESCLEGTLDASLLDLKHLNYLDLSFNYFQGQMPKFIGSLSNLEHLNLSNVGLTGVIPHEIGNLSKLTSLDLNCEYYSNMMRVESLSWLSHLRLLRELDLSGIDLSLTTNNWLSIVNSLPLLHAIRLDYCNLSLQLPLSLSHINSSKTLAIISLSGNNLNDSSIFEWLSNLSGLETNLVYLDLSTNTKMFENYFQRTEHTMNFLGNLCSLQTLRLANIGLNYNFSKIVQSLSACLHKSLVTLDLSDNNVWGSIPEIIGNFSHLRELYVDNNQLNGTISQMLGGLSTLETLSLSWNLLEGVFTSAHLSNLSNLSFLNLEYNPELVVNISANWVPPFQLDELILESCKVGPDFPMWLITQKRLIYIHISNTGISGTIPDSFFNSLSSKLESLLMSRNKMYGVLPNLSITSVASSYIDLSSNNFSGAIPLYLRNVTVLHLNNNQFSKGLVSFLCPQTKMPLTYLDLSNNSISDKLPDCWGYFDKLAILHLENNKVWGNLPISIGALNQLKALHLSNNNLSGEISSSLLNCTSLTILDLAHNSLSGYIPSTLGDNLKNLSILILRDNKIFGTLPSSLCHISRLQILDLSNNRINGTIPRCIYNLLGMVNTKSLLQDISIDLSPIFKSFGPVDNTLVMWKGREQLLKTRYILGHVKSIDFSNNILEGQIPEEIAILAGLKEINLSRNHLSGGITSRIGQLTSLESLDLSHNHLFGEIPVSLAKISSLEVLDLSYNNLFGQIPDGTQIQSLDPSSFIGNPELCGLPLPKCDGDEAAIIPVNVNDKHHNNDNFMLGVYISVVLGFIIGFWGVFGTLILKASWRYAFFRLYDNIKDRIYVMVMVNIAGVWRRS
ncbi:receptor-like protein EIX2 [Silene latifolia]|uniref:receptor-like protein EIX2 n=1 Tax=Silene latifolia TaxID=37657 RepID=UPI003D78A6EF